MMRWGKFWKVAIFAGSIILATVVAPYWIAVGEPPKITWTLFKGKQMVKHGLFPGASRGSHHGSEWAVYTWSEPYRDVIARAKSEFVGWEIEEVSPESRAVYTRFSKRPTETFIVISAIKPPANGKFEENYDPIPDLNSVVIEVYVELPDNAYNDFRTQHFLSSP